MTDAARSEPPAHTKVTREEWLQAALDTLIEDGVDRVKILNLATRLQVSRSSFYWYFKDRRELLDTLLDHWRQTNTRAIAEQAALPSQTITEGIIHVFRCWVDERLFDPRLDFAIREWARRSSRVRQILDAADDERVRVIAGLFERHGFEPTEAFVRARVLYFMQIGYYALDLGESLPQRQALARHYLKCFSGQDPRPEELTEFFDWTERAVPGG